MLKKLMQKAVMLAGILLACGQVSHATLGVLVSSNSNVVFNDPVAQPATLLLKAGESATAILYSTAPLQLGATVNFEFSTVLSGFTNWTVFATTATGMGGFNNASPLTILFPTVTQTTMVRWNVLTSTNSQGARVPAVYTIKDNDDTVTVLKNSKSQDSVYFNDDSVNVFGDVKPDRIQYQQTVGAVSMIASTDGIVMSSYTQIGWKQPVPKDKTWAMSIAFATNTIQVDKTWNVIRATGVAAQAGDGTNGFVLSARPIISTETAVNGDRISFISRTSSITFTDNGAVAGTGLRLGATTRALGLGDILELIFFNGFWQEIGFVNNQE